MANKKDFRITHEELIRRNAVLAKLMGWWLEGTSWFMHDDVAIRVAYSYNTAHIEKDRALRDLPFSRDAKYLFQVIERLRETVKHSSETNGAKTNEYFIDEFEMKFNSFYGRLIQWTQTGWRMYDTENINHDLSIFYIVGENCEDYLSGMYLFLSDIAEPIVRELPEPENPNNKRTKSK